MDLTQPPPKPGRESVTDFLIENIKKRREFGIKKYGCSLQTWNGRDPYADAIEEELDRMQYLTQARMERRSLIEAHEKIVSILETGEYVLPQAIAILQEARGMYESGITIDEKKLLRRLDEVMSSITRALVMAREFANKP